MQPLPIPPLDQTLERFIAGVAPLLTKDEINQTKAAATRFQSHCGELLQQRLLQFAQQQDEKDISWLTEIKLAAYLQDVRPLALCNNPGMQLDYPSNDQGLQRAASFIHRVVRVHIRYLNGEIEQPVDARGQPISMYNWRVLSGALREPLAEGDRYYYAQSQTANRTISLMWQGHHIALQVTNEEGEVFSVKTLMDALQTIVDGEYEQPDFDFMALSALGSQKTGAYLEELCNDPHNQNVYQALRDSLFCLSLYHSGKNELEQLHEQTFMPGFAWQYKPFSYQIDLDSDFVCLHFEHSEIDGGALKIIYTTAFEIGLDDQVTGQPGITPLDWVCEEAVSASIRQDIDAIASQARHIQSTICHIDHSAITTKISHDAILQFALIYAQLKVFDQVRLTYEAVDTSHYKAGRTEAMRPNSREAIELCQSLLTDNATKEQLDAALNMHRKRVIACKTGQAYDRHLTGLQMMIRDNDDKDCIHAFFNSPGYQALTGGDFLSTTSMGNRSPIIRVIFVPTTPGGFGVYYSDDNKEYEFLLTGDQQGSPYLDQLRDGCIEGANKLIELVASQAE
ncbi:MAG: hypothetical protein CSA52_02810 [Gammaproteobacteria bacterium]|nr:MAG: hypothetical protein CSB48_04480 [Pseudomonadota bacterium]PIE38331.1 MAG: hypothetical protein CSA52_02810 [Gammaproteobacteria bacterium]